MVSAAEYDEVLIKFREDGTPCNTFIRFCEPVKRLKLRFELSEAFVPEEPGISVEVKMLHWKKAINRSFIDEKCDDILLEDGQSGTVQYHLQTANRCYAPGFIQLPPPAIRPDDLKIITLVSKWMGNDLEHWPRAFEIIKKLGYNMIHFTPLQKRGLSNSPYSIQNQLELSDDLFAESGLSIEEKLKQFKSLLEIMQKDYNLMGMIDMVWNHTACDSPWLLEHPEAGYNLENSPHLKVAFDLDEAILKFSAELEDSGRGLVSDENALLSLLNEFKEQMLPNVKLWEYFVIDVTSSEHELETAIKASIKIPKLPINSLSEAVTFDKKFDRFSHQMNLDFVLSFYASQIENYLHAPLIQRDTLLSQILAEYRRELDELNLSRYQKYDEVINRACQNIFNRFQYERLAEHGPKLGPISRNCPLVSTYFTRIIGVDGKKYALANNGWIWNADPFQNFAESGSDAYLLREVIVWGDCVKLRYGSCQEDNPWLWQHMAEYTKQMASMFEAFRIDNCHSTPIHVAEFLLREARSVRSDLFVCAELFTGSAEKDLQFVSRLGINSLIREAMVAWDSNEIARLALNYGGRMFGSFSSDAKTTSIPHNIFFDCTHDNEPPAQKRLPQDTLSNSAIVAFSNCATGSTFGYDHFIPQHLNIVSEKRKYDLQSEAPMAALKALLNDLHCQMNAEGCTEIYTQRYAHDVIQVSRDNPQTRRGYTLITRCAYQSSDDTTCAFEEISFPGYDIECLFTGRVSHLGPYQRNRTFINGIPATIEVESSKCDWFASTHTESGSTVHLKSLEPGAVIVLRRRLIAKLPSEVNSAALQSVVNDFSLIDLNYLIYKCDAEERDDFRQNGVYNVPGYGALAYCGFAGAWLVLKSQIVPHDVLEHPLCENLRQGTWLLEYLLARLQRKGFTKFADWFSGETEAIKQTPQFLRPKYTWTLLEAIMHACQQRAFSLMNPKLTNCSDFARQLAMASVQLIGQVPSTGLHPTGPSQASLSAGLPHFSTHHMRCWGRDIFISFRGLFLHCGRFSEAREHLLAFAGCTLHGLIPNLLDSARRPRFNARDATWWFLQALQDYCKFAPEGHAILNAQVPLRFPDDEYIDCTHPAIFSKSLVLHEIVQSILQKHATGIHFREWNAGPALDSVMRDEGFQIDICTDWKTGFIHGGNRWNCGTWMDKMGESELAGNRGVPSTPRDGAPIEIIALLKSTLDWLAVLPEFGFKGVQKDSNSFISFSEWAQLLEDSFERHFYIPEDASADKEYALQPELIKRRGIYKDVLGSTSVDADYQMRPNHLLAMAIAPSLFNPRHARRALILAERHLTGPLGMRTLDPADPQYRPDYFNGHDSTDASIARGANYHQGPEWLWCMGFYLRAWLTFNLTTADTKSTRKLVLTRLQPHRHFLFKSAAGGLPELTNAEGRECADSCWLQAWSMACILDVLMELEWDGHE